MYNTIIQTDTDIKQRIVSPEKVNYDKIFKTVRGSIKKAIFYLDCPIPYDLSEALVKPNLDNLKELYLKYPVLEELIKLDAEIRTTDDILDDELSKIEPKPVSQMKQVIDVFASLDQRYEMVVKLFRTELEILTENLDLGTLEDKIKKLIQVRPCDFFLLVDVIHRYYPSKLNKDDFYYSYSFYLEFQALRDLLDDIMSIEEDIIKNDYNSIVVGKNKGLSYNYFVRLISKKFELLNNLYSHIETHPNRHLLKHSIKFWEEQYELLFKPLLTSYYIDINEFREIYFMFKQV